MPSARQQEVHEPLAVQTDGLGGDLYSLLREIQASNVSQLNSLHGRGKILFAEGEPARGVHILRSGRASLSISSSEGRVVILRLAQPGDVLGLSSVLQNSSYDMTVKTLAPCRTDFISRAELIELMERSQPGAHAILKALSHELTELTDRARSLLLPQTACGRLASLLLEWCKDSDRNNSHLARIDRLFTQEEIAQMIGSSRETVTRLLAGLGRRQIIRISSDCIFICDRAALEAMALA